MGEHHCNVCGLPFLTETGMKIHASKMHTQKTKTKTKEISELNDQMLYELCEVFGESNSSKVPTANNQCINENNSKAVDSVQNDYQKNEHDTMPKQSCESKIKYKNKKLCTFQKCNDNGLDESFSLNNPDDESETDVEGKDDEQDDDHSISDCSTNSATTNPVSEIADADVFFGKGSK